MLNRIKHEVRNNYFYYLSLFLVVLVSSVLNWNSNLMEGILPYYRSFTNYFVNGFEYSGENHPRLPPGVQRDFHAARSVHECGRMEGFHEKIGLLDTRVGADQ